jgi:hypothetical protein
VSLKTNYQTICAAVGLDKSLIGSPGALTVSRANVIALLQNLLYHPAFRLSELGTTGSALTICSAESSRSKATCTMVKCLQPVPVVCYSIQILKRQPSPLPKESAELIAYSSLSHSSVPAYSRSLAIVGLRLGLSAE